MSASPHQLLLASAGTGKTFRLTGHFLRLCFAGVEPARLLATTFTRKAAGEIQERVLLRLVEAAGDARKREELRAQLGRDALSAEECAALLARLARGLDRLNVRTLDAFFAQVARLFAFDLSLPVDWRIADEREAAELRAEAIAAVLERAPANERLELLRALQRESGARSVHSALVRIVEEVRASALDCDAAAWDCVRPGTGLAPEDFARALAALEATPLPLTDKRRPVQNWQNSQRDALAALRAEDWEGFLAVGLVKKVLEGETSYSRKPISAELGELITALSAHAAAQELATLARRNAATREFLTRYEAAYGELQRERGSLRFEDVPPALLSGGAELQLDMAYRMDGRIDHLLLDEFQDTAPLQWRVLETIAAELLAEGTAERSFFCVGDVKQSIYGWRSAEPRLLANLAQRCPVLEVETMRTSYRSSRVVLETVDRIFGNLLESPLFPSDERGTLRAAAERWLAGYAGHEAARELPGSATLFEAPPAREGERAELPALHFAVERVAALIAAEPQLGIGVLVRRNRYIPWLIDRLRALGIHASGEGGNPLTDSEAVLAFLALLHLADHPGDSAAAFHVASSPFGPPLGLALADFEARAPELSRELRARIARDGHGGLAAALAPVVAAERERWGDWDRRRYARLVDMAHAFDARAGLRPVEFADHVRKERVDEPGAADVRVMTVHASKGLEFDAVILPELDQSLITGRSRILARRRDPYAPVDALTLTPKKLLSELDPSLRELRDEARAAEFEGALSVLYVALTRAARRLELIVRHRDPERPSAAATCAALLRHALGAGERAPDGALWRHADSVARCAPAPAPAPASAGRAQPAEVPSALRLKPAGAAQELRARSASQEEGAGAGVRELLRARSSAGTGFGTLVHRWLEELEWLDAFGASDEELLALGARLEPDAARRRAALRYLRAALERPEIRALLTRAVQERPGVALEVERERRFAVFLPRAEDGVEELWSGSIDRLVLEREGGRLIGARVLDYKTDTLEAADPSARVEYYRPQLAAYRRVVARMTGLDIAAIRSGLVFLGPGLVLDL